MNEVSAYWNGSWMPQSSLHIGLNDYGFLMGVSVVERLRTFNHKPYRVEQHLARLHRSLETLQWDSHQLVSEVREAIAGFVQRNQPHMQTGDDWSIALFITPGDTLDGSAPNVCVHGNPLPFSGWAHQFAQGLDAVIVDVRQTPNNCWPAHLKCRSRMHYYLADREAQSKAPGSRAILLDQCGFVAEGSTANVAAYFKDRGLVFPQAGNVLPGISQMALEEVADVLGVAHCAADMTPEEFSTADEIYLISTSSCLLPVVRLTGKPVGSGNVGPMFTKLLDAWSEQLGVNIADQAVHCARHRDDAG